MSKEVRQPNGSYFRKPRITWEVPRRKPRITWEGLREGQPVVITPRKVIYSYFPKPRIYGEPPKKRPRITWETGNRAA